MAMPLHRRSLDEYLAWETQAGRNEFWHGEVFARLSVPTAGTAGWWPSSSGNLPVLARHRVAAVQGCPRGLVVDNALALDQATKRVVHNCEAPGGQPVFNVRVFCVCGIDAAQENSRRYESTSVPPW